MVEIEAKINLGNVVAGRVDLVLYEGKVTRATIHCECRTCGRKFVETREYNPSKKFTLIEEMGIICPNDKTENVVLLIAPLATPLEA